MVVRQGSDKNVRAGTRLNKHFTNFETPGGRGGCLVRGGEIHKPGLRDERKRESRSTIYVVYCRNCIFFPVSHIKSLIIRQFATVTSSLLNKAFDNKVLTPQTRPEGAQGQRQWREKEREEFLHSHSQSSTMPSVSLPSDNFQC